MVTDFTKPYFDVDIVKALRLLCKDNKLGVDLKGSSIFYPGCYCDFTLNKALSDKAFITNNDIVFSNNPKVEDFFIKNYSGVKGSCLEVFKSFDYDTLFLKDVHVLSQELIDKADLILTCREGHFVHKDYLKDWELIGVFVKEGNRIFIDTDSLVDYDTYPSDEVIRLDANYKSHFNKHLNDLKDKRSVSDFFLSDLLKMSENGSLVSLVKNNYDNLEEFMSNRFNVSDTYSLLLLNDALYFSKEDFISKIKDHQHVKSLSDIELVSESDFNAINDLKNNFCGPDYLKNGFLYVYTKKL